MKAIKTTGAIDEQGNLVLDTPLATSQTGRVEVIVLFPDVEDETDESKESVLQGLRQAWKESEDNETVAIEQFWDGIDAE